MRVPVVTLVLLLAQGGCADEEGRVVEPPEGPVGPTEGEGSAEGEGEGEGEAKGKAREPRRVRARARASANREPSTKAKVKALTIPKGYSLDARSTRTAKKDSTATSCCVYRGAGTMTAALPPARSALETTASRHVGRREIASPRTTAAMDSAGLGVSGTSNVPAEKCAYIDPARSVVSPAVVDPTTAASAASVRTAGRRNQPKRDAL
jgi:hypothetical protein